MDSDAEDLIAHLSCACGLDPRDRDAFRRAAEDALGALPQCSLEPGSVHRAVVTVWRDFFNPPVFEGARTAWESGKKKPSKLLVEGPKNGHRARRMRMVK